MQAKEFSPGASSRPIGPGRSVRCPSCGGDNRCGMARGEATCWCREVAVPDAILRDIAANFPGHGCLCRSCLEKAEALR